MKGAMMVKKDEVLVVDPTTVPDDWKMKVNEAQALRSEILELKGDIEKTYYRMGSKLKMVSQNTLEDGVPLWKSWGFGSFDEYCERELGFRERKAYYLLDVFSAVEKGAFTESDVERLGWTKAATLAPLVNKGIITTENASDWMEKVDGKTFNEIREMSTNARAKAATVASDARRTATAKGLDPEKAVTDAVGKLKVDEVIIPSKSPETVHVFRVGLPTEQWNVWQNALQKAKEITGSDKDPWLMECIAQSFLAECLNGREDLLETLLSRIETAYAVKILAVRHSGEIDHCHPDIAELANKVL